MADQINEVVDKVIQNLDGADFHVLKKHYSVDIQQSRDNGSANHPIFWNDILKRVEEIKVQVMLASRAKLSTCSFCLQPSDHVGALCQINSGPQICLACAKSVVEKLTDDID